MCLVGGYWGEDVESRSATKDEKLPSVVAVAVAAAAYVLSARKAYR